MQVGWLSRYFYIFWKSNSLEFNYTRLIFLIFGKDWKTLLKNPFFFSWVIKFTIMKMISKAEGGKGLNKQKTDL